MNEKFVAATIQNIKALKQNHNHGSNYNYWNRQLTSNNLCSTDELPWGLSVDALKAEIGIPKDLTCKSGYITPKTSDHYLKTEYDYSAGYHKAVKTPQFQQALAFPFFVFLRKEQDEPTIKQSETFLSKITSVHYLHNEANTGNHWCNQIDVRNCNVAVTTSVDGNEFLVIMPFGIAESLLGLKITDGMTMTLSNGVSGKMTGVEVVFSQIEAHRQGNYRDKITQFDYTYDTLNSLVSRIGMNRDNTERFLKNIDPNQHAVTTPKMSGIAKTWQKLQPYLVDLKKDSPVTYCDIMTLASYSGRSVDGVKIGVLFNEMFGKVESAKDMVKTLKEFHGKEKSHQYGYYRFDIEDSVKELSCYKEKRRAVIKSQGNRALTKIMEEVESLNIDKDKYKLTWAQIESGNLPIGVFFRKSEQYHLLNDNWDLWEGMFKSGFQEQAIELANEVKGRTTYEKDLMSYFYFILHGLPDYLKKHTGHKWKCIPKLVNSSEELEPPAEEGGIARKRSALTPIVDNDNYTVEVPYASLAIYGGRGTTYCYSHDYHVLTNGYSLGGYAVTNELEKKLNGRDDYGLMFYTLTGSAQGRGYPTFLIIFERRSQKGDTKVHFHRTHPSRSKDGDYAPIHNWVRLCYNWMAGNIKRDRIKAQQGDLAFVQIKTEDSGENLEGASVKNLDFSHEVNSYDSHKFENPVKFAEYTNKAKSNILGYVNIEKDTWLRHNEHDDVLIPKGTYAIHQCRSWEANPKGVWSLRID